MGVARVGSGENGKLCRQARGVDPQVERQGGQKQKQGAQPEDAALPRALPGGGRRGRVIGLVHGRGAGEALVEDVAEQLLFLWVFGDEGAEQGFQPFGRQVVGQEGDEFVPLQMPVDSEKTAFRFEGAKQFG
jgi:hypothetical protein